jgi:hypothetical protein
MLQTNPPALRPARLRRNTNASANKLRPNGHPGADPIKKGSNSLLKSIFQGKKQETGQAEAEKLL